MSRMRMRLERLARARYWRPASGEERLPRNGSRVLLESPPALGHSGCTSHKVYLALIYQMIV